MINNNDITISGVMKINDNLDASGVNVSGIFKMKGNLTSQRLQSSGIAKILGSAEITEVSNSGILKICGKLKTNKLISSGVISVDDVDAEIIKINGKVNVENNMNCDQLTIDFKSKSFVGSIEASSINIKCYRFSKKLHVNTISADEIKIENVICEKITGNNVIIGPNCKINYLEYINSIEIDKSSKVINKQKI